MCSQPGGRLRVSCLDAWELMIPGITSMLGREQSVGVDSKYAS